MILGAPDADSAELYAETVVNGDPSWVGPLAGVAMNLPVFHIMEPELKGPLQGMGGIGKTVLAQALCHNEVVRQAYPDGIFWFAIGKKSRFSFDQRIEAIPGLRQLLGAYSGQEACISQYRNAFRERAALIVLDDVWHAADIEPFRTESPRSRLLVTTRDTGIAPTFGAREFTAFLPTADEALEVLARWAGLQVDALPPQAREVIAECQNLPLALAMIGAQLKGKHAAHWDVVLGHLRRADLAQIKARFPEPHTSLFRAIQVSFEALSEETPVYAERYLGLAVMLEDMAVAPAVQQTLWNVDEAEALETADRFVGLSLAQRDASCGGIRLHDLQLDYVRAQYPDPEALELIRSAVRLSAHVIEKDPRQFASQVVGRLLPHRGDPLLRQLLNNIVAGAPRPWLRPLQPALHPPGTSLLRTLAGHSFHVSAVAVLPDGKRAVSASWDKTLRVWDLETGRTLRTLEGHSSSVYGVAVTPDGKRVVSASQDNTLKLWDLESGRALRTMEGHSGEVSSVVVMPDGRTAVSASWDKTMRVWDLDRDTCTLMRVLPSDATSGVATMPDSKRVISASKDGTLALWNLDSGSAVLTLKGPELSLYAAGVTITRDGKRVVCASGGNNLTVWDLEIGRVLRTLEGHSAPICAIAVSPDGWRAVSASQDHTLKVWNLESRCASPLVESHSGPVYGIAPTPDRRRIVSASGDCTVKVWDLETGGAPHILKGHTSDVFGVAVSPDGRRAISASRDGTARVWDLETGRTLRILVGHTGSVFCVAVGPDGRWGVSASEFEMKLWDLDTGCALGSLDQRFVTSVAVTSNGNLLVSASRNCTLSVWRLDTRRILHTLEGHLGNVLGVAVAPDGRRAVSASEDNTLIVWDLNTGRPLRALESHLAAVTGVAIASDGKLAVSASRDHTLKMWDLDTGQVIATFHCDGPAHCCAFAGAQRVVAGDALGCVHILSLDPFPSDSGRPTRIS